MIKHAYTIRIIESNVVGASKEECKHQGVKEKSKEKRFANFMGENKLSANIIIYFIQSRNSGRLINKLSQFVSIFDSIKQPKSKIKIFFLPYMVIDLNKMKNVHVVIKHVKSIRIELREGLRVLHTQKRQNTDPEQK